jgi:hypothetical protein
MDLKTLHNRIEALAKRALPNEAGAAPHTVLVLPDNGRGLGNTGPLPRVSRSGSSVVIIYDPRAGEPDEAAIAALLGEVRS